MTASTRSIEAAFPLTPLQEGMLYHTLRDPTLGVFHVQCTAELDGPLVLQHFERAWELATMRHAALRTFFAWEGRERPLQVVRPRVGVEMEVLDWHQLDPATRAARWRDLLARDRQRGFDLAVAPLMRVTLARFAPNQHGLLWAMHHGVLDGWSALVVLDEIMRDYAVLAAGGAPNVDPEPSFDRFVGWLEAQDRTRDERFWKDTLADFASPTPLPGVRPTRRRTGERVKTTLTLSEDETRDLRAAAARLHVTVNTLLTGAWAVMLARHAGRDDVVFGVTVSERPAEIAGVDRAAGLYLSTVPLRAPVQRGARVGDWLRGLQLRLSDARAHAAPGLATIQRWSELASGSALFESLVVFENFPVDSMRPFVSRHDTDRPLSDGALTLHSAAMDVPNDVPLVLLAIPGERLTLNIVRDPSLVADDIAARLPSHLSTLLAAFSRDSEGALEHVPMLGAAELALVRDDWSGATVEAPAAVDVVARFEQQALASPSAIALQTEYETVTYGALDHHANRLAHRLTASGLDDGKLVGILAEQAADAIIGMLAVLKAGAAYVPLDHRAPNVRLGTMLASLNGVLATPALAKHVGDVTPVVALDAATGLAETRPPIVATRDNAAYVVFTSGSTGEPKGVIVERGHLAASNAARDVYYPESPRSFLLLSPMSVDSSVAGIYWTLATGGTLVFPPPRGEQDVEGLTRLIERTGVTHTLLVPSLYRALLEHAEPRRLASLRCVIVAGEHCQPDVVRLHHARLPEAALHNEYGPSEATVWATTTALEDKSSVTIGRPIPGARIYLLDEALRPVPVGSVGEICIGGAGVARGYLGRPNAASPRFVADPFVPSERIYRTGDRGRFRPDGHIEFLGRNDEQIKIRGFRVEPSEIERALIEYPGVREAAVGLVGSHVASDSTSLVAALAEMSDADVDQILRDVEASA